MTKLSEAQRIIVIGCSGSGKTTLSNILGETTGLPVIHLDKIFWKPGWVETPKEEFARLVEAEIRKERWIIDGNYGGTMDKRIELCDTIIFLDLSRRTCLNGAISRWLMNLGKNRPDMGAGCPEKMDLEFLRFIWSFNKRGRAIIYKRLENAKNKNLIILKKRSEFTTVLHKFGQ